MKKNTPSEKPVANELDEIEVFSSPCSFRWDDAVRFVQADEDAETKPDDGEKVSGRK